MPLSWNDIKSRALSFSKEWQDASNEDSEAKPFLIAFFEVFGVTNKRIAQFESSVKKFGGKQGFIDLFWRGVLLVEMKSRGRSLDRAFDQALGYFEGIKEADLPRYILVCDFATFALTDLEKNETISFPLEKLVDHVHAFGFIAGYTTQIIQPQDPINIKAAEQMGKLHDQLKAIGYEGHSLEVYLVRLLFCLFAEDTGIFQTRRQFQDYIENKTKEDGSDLAHHLATLFYILNTPPHVRLKNLDEDLADFPYINGKLFEEMLPPASFDREMREALLSACALDWSRISPAIFGSLFQSIMDKDARRNLGAHYTSEENILKLIKPLFLDDLWVEFDHCKKNTQKLTAFHHKLASLTFFDPACGCGNFLVITYREIRRLELELLKKLHQKAQQILDVSSIIQVDVNQCYGIEIEEFPAQIAQVALWLTDHQMNQQASEQFGQYFARIPLKKSANILHANALQTDWNRHCPSASYIIGNPPFIGKNYRNDQQDADLARVFTGKFNSSIIEPRTQGDSPDVNSYSLRPISTDRQAQGGGYISGAVGSDCAQYRDSSGWVGDQRVHERVHGQPICDVGTEVREQIQSAILDDNCQYSTEHVYSRQAVVPTLTQILSPIRLYKSLDFVSAWHYTATAYMKNHPNTKTAFVSTNSITQGEQVAILWQPLLDAGVHIHFAHRTFSWTNEAKGKAAVHVVIIGFALQDTPHKTLFVYDDIKGEPHAVKANNINPYLLDAPSVVITSKKIPICNVPEIKFGNMPNDGGHLLLSQQEKDELVKLEPQAEKYIRLFIGSEEFINNIPRYCLWLVDCPPSELRSMPLVLKRIDAVKAMRQVSTRDATKKLAETPSLFGEIRQPSFEYIAVPKTSSERKYIPTSVLAPSLIASTEIFTVSNGSLYHFGILTSTMHNAWMRTVAGRLKSDYRYSANLVYNTFPWAEPTDKQTQTIEQAAQAVLSARAQFPTASLADLYDPRTMPPDLAKAHTKLDKAVDTAYGYKGANNDGERVAFLFDLYQKMTSLLSVADDAKVKKVTKRTKKEHKSCG